MLSILTEPLHNIAVSSLSKLRNDVEELKRSWTTALSSLTFFSAAIFSVLAVTAQDFVVILLGAEMGAGRSAAVYLCRARHRP